MAINGYLPLNYEQLNIQAGTYFPSQVKPYNNAAFIFWQRALFQRACSTIIIDVPEDWKRHKNLLYWSLFAYGYVGVFNLEEFGKCFNPVTLSGYNFYYEPTNVLLSNPALKPDGKQEFEIGTTCELLRLTPDYAGIWDIISYYAEKLASMDCAINTAIINTKFVYIMGAKNKAAAAVLKKMFDKVSQGEPAVNSYIITDLLKDFQTILNDFDCEVGIPTIPYEKKERMVQSEAESRQIDSTSRSVVWFDELKRTAELCNEFLGFGNDGIKITLRYNIEERGEEDGESKDNTGGLL